MKVALTLLAIVAFATATEMVDPFVDRSFSSIIVGAIESIRDQMPCGFPELGIPPLAPLKIEHYDVNTDTPSLRLSGSLDNFVLYGLNNFDIITMKVNPITSKVTFHFHFKNITVDTLYDLKLFFKKVGFTINMVGNGPSKFAIKDLHISGTMKYSFNFSSYKLKLKSLNPRTNVDKVDSKIEGILGEGVLNQMMNKILEDIVAFVLNENEDLITEYIENIVLPIINDFLNNQKLSEFIGSIVGAADDDEKEECIPFEE